MLYVYLRVISKKLAVLFRQLLHWRRGAHVLQGRKLSGKPLLGVWHLRSRYRLYYFDGCRPLADMADL